MDKEVKAVFLFNNKFAAIFLLLEFLPLSGSFMKIKYIHAFYQQTSETT